VAALWGATADADQDAFCGTGALPVYGKAAGDKILVELGLTRGSRQNLRLQNYDFLKAHPCGAPF
jgi:hypothetical protein